MLGSTTMLIFTVFQILLGVSVVRGYDRIVTNVKDVENGVRPDHRYREPKIKGQEWRSVEGCPKSDAGNPWVMYGKPARCYLTGTQGPCGEEQTFVAEKGNKFGYCMCDCLWRDFTKGKIRDKASFCLRNQILVEHVFIPKYKGCFQLYDQGPCNKGEWLTKSKTGGEVQCGKRLCSKGEIPFFDQDQKFRCVIPQAPYNWSNSLFKNQKKCGWSLVLSKTGICVKTLSKNFVL